MTEYIFRRPVEEYKRDVNPIGGYIEDMAFYLSKMTGKPIDYTREFVKAQIKSTGQLPIKNPKVIYAEREDYEDRFEKEGTLLSYLGDTIRRGDILAPTLTTYVRPEERESVLRSAIKLGIASRSKKKKTKFVHEQLRNQYRAAKNEVMAMQEHFKWLLNDALEKVEKIRNNSYSGGYVSKSTPLANKSSHAALTSTCRATSGYANSNNEKLISGNRHYFHPQIVMDNLITISRLTDLKAVERVIEKYKLHYPTVQETMQVIEYSARLYWEPRINKDWIKIITDLVERLTPIERAAFCYVSDFYHIRTFNDAFTRNFFGRLSARVEAPDLDVAVAEQTITSVPDSYLALGMSICAKESTNVDKIAKLKGTQAYLTIAATTANIYQTLYDYKDFLQAFFVTSNMPVSMAHFPDSMRRIALISDTDSTIFTVQNWVKWYTGSYDTGPEADALDSTMIFFAAEAITHILANMSKNMGIDNEYLFTILMKNEFKFSSITPTQLAKHYFGDTIINEGNVYEVSKPDIKGVGLRTIKIPAEILNDATSLMNEVMHSVKKNEKLYLAKILKRVADMERSVYNSLLKGDVRFFRAGRIADKSGYTLPPEQSPYQNFIFWNEVWAPSYSVCPPPPFQTINATLNLNSPTKIKAWTDTFEDRALADRLLRYIARTGKTALGTFVIPRPMLDAHGLPKECVEHLQVRQLVKNASSIYYLILDSLGVYLDNSKLTRLFMDEF